MNYFHFEEKTYIKENKTVYKIVNDVERRIRSSDKKRVRAGSSGGYVEHPELLDPSQDIWIYEDATILGNTTIEGKVSIRSAVIKDCTIRGIVQIGQTHSKEYLEDILYTYKMQVRLDNCIIDSRDLDGDNTDELEAMSVLKIMDYTYAKGCKFYGCSEIFGRNHLINSEIRSSYINDYAGIINSRIRGNAVVEGSAFVYKSTIDHCLIKDNSIVKSCKAKNLQALDHDQFEKGRQINGNKKKPFLNNAV